ncbi:MAG: DUF4860 domain-containing protein [Coriobacteriales bacterium]|jgi:hypothetical protein|nr:DUF4860 domain-containing protein [Coriobacteriales bacterium]
MARRHALDLVAVVALFFVYAVCALLLCVIGAEVYRGTAQTMQQNFDQRTGVLYVAEKIRQNDLAGAVRTGSVGGADALVLVEQRSGRNFETWLFVSDQVLYEGLFAPGDPVDVRLCQAIMPMAGLTLEEGEATGGGSGGDGDGGSTRLVNATFHTVEGRSSPLVFCLRSGRR